jgi:tetratricopeptide (TPR) repeat protein
MEGDLMRRWITGCVAALVMLASPVLLHAEGAIAKGDRLFYFGGLINLLRSADLYAKASDADPKNYEAAWKASRAYRESCLESIGVGAGDFKATCRKFGKLGMKYGERAMATAPRRVEGNYWFGCSAGCYVEGVSVLTAIREGLKDKTRISFERAYAADKLYYDGGPIKALGRFWHVLPWPFGSSEKSLAYLREYQKRFPHDPEGQVYLAEVLIDSGNTGEARNLLRRAASSGEPFFSKRAAVILAQLAE